MNALTQSPSQISEEDYLARYAQESDTRYEYINGEIWAMAGASRNHNIIAGNVYAALHSQLKNHPCQAFISDWRVQAQHNYYYPDVVIDCQAQGSQAIQPVLIIEVLSDSTRQTDLTLKLHDYRQIPSLQEYIVLEQNFMAALAYRRSDDWKATSYTQASDTISLASIGCTLSLAEIYARVEFEEKRAV